MAAEAFVALLNEQIAHEYAAHQQYVACAVYYDAETLPQLARFFYAQALEERDHAMMMVQYLIDADEHVVVPGVAAPQVDFADGTRRPSGTLFQKYGRVFLIDVGMSRGVGESHGALLHFQRTAGRTIAFTALPDGTQTPLWQP